MSISEMFSLTGKKALVTGAAKTTGLCYGMAKALSDAGARVVLMDISKSVHELAETMGGKEKGIFSVEANLTDLESLNSGFEKACAAMGGVDILLNGAGIQHREDAIDFPADKWDAIIAINLSAVFYLSQTAARYMIKHGGGSIINIASMTSFLASRRIPAYTASKGGVAQLTKALSNEWASQGVRVNAIAPGYMETELTANMIHTEQGRQHTLRIPMGRWGKPEDLQGAVIFLASSASNYVSGAIIPIDGGYLGA